MSGIQRVCGCLCLHTHSCSCRCLHTHSITPTLEVRVRGCFPMLRTAALFLPLAARYPPVMRPHALFPPPHLHTPTARCPLPTLAPQPPPVPAPPPAPGGHRRSRRHRHRRLPRLRLFFMAARGPVWPRGAVRRYLRPCGLPLRNRPGARTMAPRTMPPHTLPPHHAIVARTAAQTCHCLAHRTIPQRYPGCASAQHNPPITA